MKIEFNGVYKAFDHTVLSNFQCSLTQSAIHVVLGESGGGKSVFLKLCGGILRPDSGQISVLAQKGISYLFQENRLLPWLTAWDNVLAVNAERETCHELFQRLSLSGCEGLYPHQLSGGMKRRVALARSLAYGGDIFLWDEPFTGIDWENKQQIMHWLQPILSQKLCVLVTHDRQEAEFLADYLYTLKPEGLILRERKK